MSDFNPAVEAVLDRIYFRHYSVIDDIFNKIQGAENRGENYLLYNAPLGTGADLHSYFSAMDFQVVLHKGHAYDLIAFGWEIL